MTIGPGGSGVQSSTGAAFKAFLSHRYRSPEINLYFYGICSHVAEVQFEVDDGGSEISIARLARMIRGADAFIGIYPFPAAPSTRVERSDLEIASRYFRLELALAARTGTPMLVYADERYRSVLPVPEWAHRQNFSVQEVTGAGGVPSEQKYRRAFEEFHNVVRARMKYQVEVEQRVERNTVGLLLDSTSPGYSGRLVQRLVEGIETHGFDAVVIPWPMSVDVASMRKVAMLDWLFIDPGDDPAGAAALGWLDGQGMPLSRLRHVRDGRSLVPAAEKSLYRGFDVGYNEDRLVWEDEDEFVGRFKKMIDLITGPVTRINTGREAEKYFSAAEKRKEKVFLSYASEDAQIADQLARQLRRKFEEVFDYRDGRSLMPGTAYPTQLFERLKNSEIGVPVLSKSYLAKKTCTHESQDMCVSLDSGTMFVYPLNVDGSKPPDYFRSLQYEAIAAPDFDADLIVEKIIKEYDRSTSTDRNDPHPELSSTPESVVS